MARLKRMGIELVVPVLLLVGYQLWSSHHRSPYFPTIPKIAKAFQKMWIGEGFRRDIVPSLGNLAKGYLIGLLLGVLIGVALGRHQALRRALSPLIAFTLTLPPVALLPLFIVFFGISAALQVGIIIFAVFFTMVVNTADAMAATDPTLHDVASSFGIRGVRRLAQVILPATTPQVLAAARSSLSIALLIMVVSELVGASRGIGVATLTAQQSFQYSRMWAGMVLLAMLGYGLNFLFTLLEDPILERLGFPSGSTRRKRR